MESQSGNTIISGIEPVDELMGGLARGQLYLVHGEASGKSLFGIKFLIEGLKHGENGALVIRYSPEDAVRRFARLGYDCLEDVYSGRLVILEYSDDIVQKIGKLRELTPVLRELEWLLGETRPERLIFDPVTSVLAGAEGNLETAAREFADWARSFGATVVLIANHSNHEIIRCFKPLVAESFRFDVREAADRAARFIAFEKSADIADQAIEVDPSRGVFLLGQLYAPEREKAHQAEPEPPPVAELASIREELRSASDQIHKKGVETLGDISSTGEATAGTDPSQRDTARLAPDRGSRDALQTHKLSPLEERDLQTPRENRALPQPDSISNDELELHFEERLLSPATARLVKEAQIDELSDLIDDLTGTALALDLPQLGSPPPKPSTSGIDLADSTASGTKQPAVESREAQSSVLLNVREAASGSADTDRAKGRTPRHSRASDLRVDSAMAARATELLLRPPESGAEFSSPPGEPIQPHAVREAAQLEQLGDAEVRTKDFNVLIIEDDAESHDLVTQTLGDYALEVAHDGVSGLGKLISFKPDLVILDFDLPIVDGFTVLTLIRSALDVPIIVLSGSRVRAIDRVMASELGADYYLTKPFSAKELKHKARQLIARYRGINSWITNPSSSSRSVSLTRPSEPAAASTTGPGPEMFVPYSEFAVEVEKRVKAAMDTGAPFSIVGCRLPEMTANRGQLALQLFEMVRGLARDTDLTSTNPRNDMVILLPDADTSGARAFAGRLQERIIEELNNEPALWMRSFPDMEESTKASAPGGQPTHGGAIYGRSGHSATHA
jgi:CheY-like chemotaxis protein/KaiC/GvpD/RAD55 family RecA-like ATPase